MKKFLSLFIAVLTVTAGYSYVPLSNVHTNLGSFRKDATHGMFYNEMDILTAAPVELMDFSGNNLYTSWSNARNDVATSYNSVLSYRALTLAPVDSTFVFGAIGTPLQFIGINGLRAGLIFQSGFGGKTDYFDLDNNIGNGFESEGYWECETSANMDADAAGVIDRMTTYTSDANNYQESTVTQWNAGAAMKLWILGAGLGINRTSTINIRNTGGKKTYNVSYLNDAGMPAGYPAGTRQGDSGSVLYPDNSVDQSSTIQSDILPQARIKISEIVKLDVGLGLRVQNSYNPTNIRKNGIEVTGSNANLFGASVVYDEYSAIREPGTLGGLDYNDFSIVNLAGTANPASAIYDPAWTGTGVDAPAVTDFSDDRTGVGPIFRAEAKLFFLTGVLNFSSVVQDIDAKITSRDYISLKQYSSATAYDSWVARDYNETVTRKGDCTINEFDLGLKVNLIENEKIRMAFAPSISRDSTLTSYTEKTNRTESTYYDDGVAGNTPGTVGLATRPSAANGEGTWSETTGVSDKIENETINVTYRLPVGFEIPIGKKWTFRAGTAYSFTKTEVLNKTISGRTTATTTATPAGAAMLTTTAITSPADNVQKDRSYTEACTLSYSYGIEWKVNDNLTIASNAFLDTNSNLGNDKATLLDLDTYRCLAIQAVFHF